MFYYYDCIKYYIKIHSTCKASFFGCCASEDGSAGPKQIRPYKYWIIYIKLVIHWMACHSNTRTSVTAKMSRVKIKRSRYSC
jgi:hypothetical protein